MNTEMSGRSPIRSNDNIQLSGERLCFRHNFHHICSVQSELLPYKKTTTTVVSYHVKMVNIGKFYSLPSKDRLGCSLGT